MAGRKHPPDEDFDFYVMGSKEMTKERRRALKEHVSGCLLCKEHLEETTKFYTELNKRLKEPPSKLDEELAKRILEGKPLHLPIKRRSKKK